jgi:hypothetical protein
MDLILREKLLQLLVACRKKTFDTKLSAEALYDFLNANYTNDELADFILSVFDERTAQTEKTGM